MNCPRCNAQNPDGSTFCNNCGLQLPRMQNQNYYQPQQNQQVNQYQYGNINQGFQMNTTARPPKIPFWKKTWFVVLMCIFFPPVGIALLWVARKPINMIARIILTAFLCLWMLIMFTPNIGDKEESNNGNNNIFEEKELKKEEKEKKENVKNDREGEEKEKELTADEYKSACIDLDYEAVSRNPDDYIGTKFKVTVEIFSVSQGSWLSGTYYKTFTDDGSGTYFNDMIWIFDKRDEDSEEYVRLLEDDIVTFYGEFNGMQETENFLNGEKGEDIALDIYYVDLLE